MKILITGGLGFVGTNLLERIIIDSKWTNITVLDNLRHTSNPEILPRLEKFKRFKFIKGDVRDLNLVKSLTRGKDYVLHLAAETFVDNSIKESRIFFETNVLGTHSVFEAARLSNVRKIILTSTDEVWGEAKGDTKFKENTSYSPRNPYSASKAASDHIATSFGETYGVNYNIVYLTNLVGPWQYPEKLIPRSIINIMLKKPIDIYGSGENIRTWLYMDDAIQGMLLVLRKAKSKEKYILGSDIQLANLELIRLLLKLCNGSLRDIRYVEDRPGHDFKYAVDYSKAKKELGWEPRWDIIKMLSYTIKWFKENEKWWRKRI